MTKKHHPKNRFERMKARRREEDSKLDAKAHKEKREPKVWFKLSKESLKDWETRNAVNNTIRGE